MKTSPNESLTTSAPALAAQALDRELNAGPSSSNTTKTTVVNDLTSMVVKKKRKYQKTLTQANGRQMRKQSR